MADHADLVSCRLPSGRTVDTTRQVCEQVSGSIVETPSGLGPSNNGTTLVICRLPGEGDVVMTHDSCIANGGMVVGKGVGSPGPAGPAD